MRSAAPRCLLGAWIVVICSSAAPSGEVRPQIIWHRDYDIAVSEAKLLDRPVLAYVTAKWCPACLRQERSTFLDKQVVKFLGESVVAVYVDADSSPELAQRLGAEKLPMSVMLSDDGVVMRRIEGYRPAESYLTELAESIKVFQRPESASVVKNSPAREEPSARPGRRAPLSRPDEIELAGHVERSAALRAEVVLSVELSSNLMLDGNSPVTFLDAKKLTAGKPEFPVEHDGRTYWLADAAELAKFERDPARYVPAMGGLCVVSLVDDNVEVDGVTRIAAIYHGRLYLFANLEKRRRFQAEPRRYADNDLANNGACPVCRIDHAIEIEGSAEHRTTFQGLLYRFDSPEHLHEFLADPERYLQTP
jgi:YHS domain-containing protein/thiol-disulfide isomerase/thioredoxin